jgi:isochorismate synthase EntC
VSRGWYASPIGWFDAAGDGAFAVALRCALVDGRRAWLFAGAGIVEGSDPELEYAETELKHAAMLSVLGAA